MNNFLELNNIRKSFTIEKKINVITGLSRKFKLGKIYAIMGPSGSGKSTLLNLISLIDRPTAGSIKFNNVEINFKEKGRINLFNRMFLHFDIKPDLLSDILNILRTFESEKKIPLYFFRTHILIFYHKSLLH